MRTALVFALGCLLGACASTDAGKNREVGRFNDGEPCRKSLHRVLEQIKRSQEMMCTGDAECALITNPASPEKGFRVAVPRRDAERLDLQASEHLKRCGAFRQPDSRQPMRVVTPKCLRQRCTEGVTLIESD